MNLKSGLSGVLLAAGCLSALFVCTSPSALAADCGCPVGPRIIDGVNVPTSRFPTVGIVTDSKNAFICTGTLIAPHFVLTAAHCVVDGDTGKIDMGQTEGRFKLNGVTYKTVHVYANPSYHGDNSQEEEDAVDLGIYELDQDVPGVTPSPINRKTPTIGTLLTLVGFGTQGTGASGMDGTFPAAGTVTTGTTPIDMVTRTFIKWNFEEKAAPNQESNTAPGDSGGPQFIDVDGVMTIASVTSGGNDPRSRFGDLSYNTRVDVGAAWIDSIVKSTGVSVQSMGVSNTTPKVGEQVSFAVAASSADKSPMTFTFDFGDGLNGTSTTGMIQHTYAAAGIYTVMMTVSDGKGSTAQSSLTLTVGLVESQITKHKFVLNFSRADKDSLDFSLFNTDLVFNSKSDFQTALDGAKIKILIDTTQIDSLNFSGMKALGTGTAMFTMRTGTVKYSVKNNSALEALLAPFGAENADLTTTFNVPLRVQINDKIYGGEATFSYKAKEGKMGNGK